MTDAEDLDDDSGLAAHWDAAYSREEASTSWFEPQPVLSLRMLDQLGVGSDASVVDVGGGASRLPDALLERGHTDVTVMDLSAAATRTARTRLGARAAQIHWVTADVRTWRPGRSFEVWHDRAVPHFLTTELDQAGYRETLAAVTSPGSVAVIATFAPGGPSQCSGLPVSRYSASRIAELFGPRWTLVADVRDDHTTPSGVTQPFTWAALRRDRPATRMTIERAGVLTP